MALVARGAYFVDGAGVPVTLRGGDDLPEPPRGRDGAGGTALRASATWEGSEEGSSDYELSSTDDAPPYGDVDYECQVERSGQNPPDAGGYTQVNNRSIDECTESRDCAPQVHFRESDRTDEEEFIDGAQVGGRSAWLRVLYPDAAAAIDRTLARKDFHWCYFLVWMGDFWGDQERSEGYTAGFRPWAELFHTVDPLSTEATAMVVVAAGVQHFAVYDYSVSRRADGLRGIHLRFWVGGTLHPSVWINGNGSLGEQDWSDIPERMQTSVGTRIQSVMMCLLNVSARVVWRPYRLCKTRYVRNQRDYPAGGLGPEAARVLYRDDEGPIVAEETYEQDRDNPDDVSWAAYQRTGGEALSVLGNVVRAQVKFVLADDDARSVVELAEAGFECVFGKRVVTRHTFDYIPNQDPTSTGYRVMARRCLTPHALVHLDEHLADARALVSGDDDGDHPWARLVYQSWDAESLDEDRL